MTILENKEADSKLMWMSWLLVVACFVLCSWWLRPVLLDDTFISLKYAASFLQHGEFAFNDGQKSFGASAPLYIVVLALLGRVVQVARWPEMAKTISIAGNLACVLCWFFLTAPFARRRGVWTGIVGTALLGASLFVVPACVRYLQNGMETSWAVALALIGLLSVQRWRAKSSPASLREMIVTAVLLALPGMWRIDLAPVSMCLLILLWLSSRGGRWMAVALSILVLTGWYAWQIHLTGYLLPDTALAKQAGGFNLFWSLALAYLVPVSPAYLFGPLALLLEGLARRKSSWNDLLEVGAGLGPILSILLVGTLRNQLPLNRYFLPMLAFSWGAYFLLQDERPRAEDAPDRSWTPLIALTLILSLAVAVVMSPKVGRAISGSYFSVPQELRRAGELVGAMDVGRLGWFAPVRILDLSGLVNGRAIARAGTKDRMCVGMGMMGVPESLVLTDPEAEAFGPGNSLEISCPGRSSERYRRTDELVMRNVNLNGQEKWFLWLHEH